MVFLAITPYSLKEALRLAGEQSHAVWCGSDAISERAFSELREPLTRLDYPLSLLDPEAGADVLATIREHHPGERVEGSGGL